MFAKKTLGALAVLTIAGSFGTSTLKADIPGLDTTTASPINYGSSSWNLGWSFSVNSATVVTGLGNFDFGSPANLSSPQQVGLWNSSGQLLASTFVTSASTQIGIGFAFTAITPIALTVGETYVVGGQGGADYTGEIPVTVAPQISYIQDLYTFNGGANSPLVEPITSEGFNTPASAAWFGGNVLLTSTPEPGFYGMLVLGFSGMVVALKRRQA